LIGLTLLDLVPFLEGAVMPRDTVPSLLFMKITTEKQTIQLGKKIIKDLRGGDILCLYGNLGAGKTTLSKGIARGLGIKKEITSPTFTLMNVYPIQNSKITARNLCHIDTYRLKNENDLLEIGAEDYLGAPDTICIIEWPEKIEGILKNKKVKKIIIEHTEENKREIKIEF